MDYFVKMENQPQFDGLCMDLTFQNTIEEHPNSSTYDNSHDHINNIIDFETIFFDDQDQENSTLFYNLNYFNDINIDEYTLFDDKHKIFHHKPENNLIKPLDHHIFNQNVTITNQEVDQEMDFLKNRNGVRSKSSNLKFDEIKKYFDVPISRAAKELKVGLTVLKKRCRELNIMRWPHRKIKSLKCLISNVKEMGLTKEIEMLEEHKRMLEKIPQMELTDKTKKLRQACFKANYKKRKSLAISS